MWRYHLTFRFAIRSNLLYVVGDFMKEKEREMAAKSSKKKAMSLYQPHNPLLNASHSKSDFIEIETWIQRKKSQRCVPDSQFQSGIKIFIF
ncbi:hypothetical protein Hanom_Chr02g00109491 [Helianthus anomalus]